MEGEEEASKVDDFGSFKYWREPVPTLDLAAILQEVSQTSNTPIVSQQGSAGNQQPSEDESRQPDAELENLSANLAASGLEDRSDNTTPTQENQSGFMFGPDSTPSNPMMSATTPTYASVLASGTQSGSRSRNISSGSCTGSESAVYDSDVLAWQQVRSVYTV